MSIRELRRIRVSCGPIGMWAYLVWRFGHYYGRRNIVLHFVYLMLDLIIVRSWAGARLPAEIQMGQRIGFVHDAHGVVIHPQVVIGNDCTIYHQVTIGHVWGRPGAPRIGNGVLVGVGALVLGPISIGDFAAIGAGAVVTTDVPEGATVVGNPARIIPPRLGWERKPRY